MLLCPPVARCLGNNLLPQRRSFHDFHEPIIDDFSTLGCVSDTVQPSPLLRLSRTISFQALYMLDKGRGSCQSTSAGFDLLNWHRSLKTCYSVIPVDLCSFADLKVPTEGMMEFFAGIFKQRRARPATNNEPYGSRHLASICNKYAPYLNIRRLFVHISKRPLYSLFAPRLYHTNEPRKRLTFNDLPAEICELIFVLLNLPDEEGHRYWDYTWEGSEYGMPALIQALRPQQRPYQHALGWFFGHDSNRTFKLGQWNNWNLRLMSDLSLHHIRTIDLDMT